MAFAHTKWRLLVVWGLGKGEGVVTGVKLYGSEAEGVFFKVHLKLQSSVLT